MKKILVVDDNRIFRVLVCELLTRAGHEVIEAVDGEDVLQQLDELYNEIDLMILDLSMPGKDGFEVLEIIRNRSTKPGFPILVVSGIYKSFGAIEQVKELGASGFVDKAVNLDELLYRINSFLNPVTEDLRESPRSAVTIMVEYRVNDIYRSALTFNISEEGMFIRTMEPLSLNERIYLRFNLPDSRDLIKIDGEVIWKNEYSPIGSKLYPPGMGIKFLNMSEKDLEKLREFLSQVKKLSSWDSPDDPEE